MKTKVRTIEQTRFEQITKIERSRLRKKLRNNPENKGEKVRTIKRSDQIKFAQLCATGTIDEIIAGLPMLDNGKTAASTWGWGVERFRQFLITGVPCTDVFNLKGNSKLPFACFSTLPGVTCPGAGECLSLMYCYSFKAHRYPGAFFAQCQNTVLLRFNKELVKHEFLKLQAGIEVRLYVDGDINSIETLSFWFGLCNFRTDLKIYGYSKSWDIFLQWEDKGLRFPSNYILNLSSGSKYGDAYKKRMTSLSCTRGEFIAIDTKGDKSRAAITREAKAQGLGKVFPCPGDCGNCTSDGHACGSERFNGVTIAIGIH
tara:strand:+ start:1536 stop:2480 length:945 start_codon:yes stop_codon:yes gene_type:complete